MTIDEIFQDSGLSQPPRTIGNDLLLWVREAQHVLDFFLLEEMPMSAHDLERLREGAGALHADLTWYYEHATPWVRMGNGLETWREHMEIAYRRLREAARTRGFVDERKADRDSAA